MNFGAVSHITVWTIEFRLSGNQFKQCVPGHFHVNPRRYVHACVLSLYACMYVLNEVVIYVLLGSFSCDVSTTHDFEIKL